MNKIKCLRSSLFLLLILFLLPVLSVQAAAEDTTVSSRGYWINPFYRSQGYTPSPSEISDDDNLLTASETADRKDYSIDRCGETTRSFFKKHVEDFTVYLISENNLQNDLAAYGRSVFDAAIQHTGVPDEGDYIENSLMYCSWEVFCTSKDGYYLTTLQYKPIYVCPYSMEEAVSLRFHSLYAELQLDGKTDYQKALIIFDYLSQNIRYDYEAAASVDNRLGHSAYNALIKHSCVCQGFSLSYYRLMLMAGVDCRIVRSTDHSWNLINIHGIYYNVDNTWASTAIEKGSDPYIYFLASNALMMSYGNHVRVWPFNEASFNTLYPTGTGLYTPTDEDLGTLEDPYGPLVLTSLKKTTDNHLIVRWEAYPEAFSYEIYRKQRSQDVWDFLDQVPANELSYKDISTQIGETYYYTVKAVLEDGMTSRFDNIGLHQRCTFAGEMRFTLAKAVSSQAVVLKWAKEDGANAYLIYQKESDSDPWTLLTTTGDVDSYVVTNLTAKHAYAFTIAPAQKQAAFTLKGAYAENGSKVTTLQIPTLTVTAKGNGKAAVKWTSCSGISGYQLCVVEKGKTTKKYTKFSGALTSVNISLTAGKTYNIRIRTRKKYNNVNYYGAWSNKVTVTIR